MDSIGLCADHAGFEMKEYIKSLLSEQGINFLDYGTFSNESVDYPDYAHKMGEAIESGVIKRGISVCGSGNGISMVMNKYPSIRAALCWDEEISRLARAHNDANVLSLPARFINNEKCKSILLAFLNTKFDGGRHQRRTEKIPIKH